MEAHSENSDSVPIAIQADEDHETRARGKVRDNLEFEIAMLDVEQGRSEKVSQREKKESENASK
jgi:hypothetical protein